MKTKLKNSTERYKHLCHLTVRVFNISNTLLPKNPGWKTLFSIWEQCRFIIDKEYLSITEAVIHYLHWGVYPEHSFSTEEKELLDTMVDEVRSKGSGYRIWAISNEVRNTCFNVLDVLSAWVSDDLCCHSYEHHLYLTSKTLSQIVPIEIINTHPSMAEAVAASALYERCITQLLSEAAGWTNKEWSDDRNILSGLAKKYDIDYLSDNHNYNRLVCLIREVNAPTNRDKLLWYTLAISRLSLPIVKVIWPDSTPETLSRLYLELSERVDEYATAGHPVGHISPTQIDPVGAFDKEYLKNCWLTKLLQEWANDDSIDLLAYPTLKRAIFDAHTLT